MWDLSRNNWIKPSYFYFPFDLQRGSCSPKSCQKTSKSRSIYSFWNFCFSVLYLSLQVLANWVKSLRHAQKSVLGKWLSPSRFLVHFLGKQTPPLFLYFWVCVRGLNIRQVRTHLVHNELLSAASVELLFRILS